MINILKIFVPITIIVMIIVAIAFLVRAIDHDNDKRTQQRIDDYQACKERTEDDSLEWCFKMFKPEL
jgi:anaerobic C4-dicarboxylate transporter